MLTVRVSRGAVETTRDAVIKQMPLTVQLQLAIPGYAPRTTIVIPATLLFVELHK